MKKYSIRFQIGPIDPMIKDMFHVNAGGQEFEEDKLAEFQRIADEFNRKNQAVKLVITPIEP